MRTSETLPPEPPDPPEPPSGNAYYVSPAGTATWAQAANIGTPCSATTAFASAAAGDTVYFRGGTYSPGQTVTAGYPNYRPTHSGSNGAPITFRNYPGETPTVDAYGATGVYGERVDFAFGVVWQDYITFDGFTCIGAGGSWMGNVMLWGTNHCVLKNLTINGGSSTQTTTENCDCIRIEYCNDYLIQNCTIYNFTQTTNYANTAGIKLYRNGAWNTDYPGIYGTGIIERCEFYDGVTPIYVKSSTDDLTIRNNFIHDCAYGVHVTPSVSVMQSDRGIVHDNLIVNITYANGFDCNNDNTAFHGNDWQIYNNTFYNCAGGAFSFAAADLNHGWKYYNNLSHNCAATYDLSGQAYDPGNGIVCRLAEEDHNQWGTGAIGFEYGRNAGYNRYGSLAAWQATTWLEGAASPGVGDLASDPVFANGSGTLTQRADFAPTSAATLTGGRNGLAMGCDVSTVGVP